MINSLQILRALAAYAVFFTHYAVFGLHVGGFGVDIFFIISGFVIAFVVEKSTKDFLLKRLIRVSPLYTIATGLTVILAFIKPEWFKSVVVSTEGIIKSLLYIPYRIDKSGPILSLGWTLNFEMLFYLSMSFCILFIKKKRLLIPFCALLLMLFLYVIQLTKADSYPLSFYGNGLLPEFIMGLFLFYFWQFLQKEKNVNKLLRLSFFGIGIAALIFLIYCGLTNDFNDVDRNIRVGIPALFIVGGTMAIEPFINGKSKLVKLTSLIGDSSYAMYLFHPFILFGCTRVLFPFIFGEDSRFSTELLKFLLISIILIITSLLIYKFLDKPLNDYLRRQVLAKKNTK